MERFHTKQFVISFILSSFALILLLCYFMWWKEMHIKNFDVCSATPLSAENGAMLCMDKCSYTINGPWGTRINIQGWCFVKGKETNPIAIHVLLRDTKNSQYFQLPTAMQQRTDVTVYFNDGTNYDNSGFCVNIDGNRFNLEKRQYEICLLCEVNSQKFLMASGKLLEEGEKK